MAAVVVDGGHPPAVMDASIASAPADARLPPDAAAAPLDKRGTPILPPAGYGSPTPFLRSKAVLSLAWLADSQTLLFVQPEAGNTTSIQAIGVAGGRTAEVWLTPAQTGGAATLAVDAAGHVILAETKQRQITSVDPVNKAKTVL